MQSGCKSLSVTVEMWSQSVTDALYIFNRLEWLEGVEERCCEELLSWWDQIWSGLHLWRPTDKSSLKKSADICSRHESIFQLLKEKSDDIRLLLVCSNNCMWEGTTHTHTHTDNINCLWSDFINPFSVWWSVTVCVQTVMSPLVLALHCSPQDY